MALHTSARLFLNLLSWRTLNKSIVEWVGAAPLLPSSCPPHLPPSSSPTLGPGRLERELSTDPGERTIPGGRCSHHQAQLSSFQTSGCLPIMLSQGKAVPSPLLGPLPSPFPALTMTWCPPLGQSPGGFPLSGQRPRSLVSESPTPKLLSTEDPAVSWLAWTVALGPSPLLLSLDSPG